jgi:hypothetical protein
MGSTLPPGLHHNAKLEVGVERTFFKRPAGKAAKAGLA